ncbi:MAG TPA: hypothetical protein VGL25_08075 [Casimicrobiaceae bacterium]
MSVLSLLFSQLLALALGASVIALFVRGGPGAIATIAAYGYVLGAIAITVILRLLSVGGIQWNFWLLALITIALTAIASVRARREWLKAPKAPAAKELHWQRTLTAAFWALIAVHVALAFNEALLRPLFPWDAAAQWATKARVWFEYRRIVPFVDDMAWIGAAGNVFTDAHPTYPGTVPLLQVWAALAWGRFDDDVINVAWPLFLAALPIGVYGQLRRLGFAALPAAAVAYMIASLPFVDVHAALAGYADLALCVVYAFALLALATWTREPSRGNALLLAACAAVLPVLKTPGWIWLATLMPGVIAVYVPRKTLGILAAAGALAIATLLAYVSYVHPITILGYQVALQHNRIADAVFSNLFLFANWHLLGFLIPLALFVAHRAMFAPAMLALTIVAGTAIIALIAVFFFSSASVEGVGAYTAVNRAMLHVVPAFIAYTALLLREYWIIRLSAARDVAMANA